MSRTWHDRRDCPKQTETGQRGESDLRVFRSSQSVDPPTCDLPRSGIEYQACHLADRIVQESKARVIAAIDEKLIGGFVLQTGDKLIDASIAYDLKNIAKQFDNNDFIYKIR